jgi:hypothetical protein
LDDYHLLPSVAICGADLELQSHEVFSDFQKEVRYLRDRRWIILSNLRRRNSKKEWYCET